MKAEHPVTKEIWFFVDKCLPFGASISCAIFQEVSDAIKFIVQYKARVQSAIVNYLDDYLFVAFTIRNCNRLMTVFLAVCSEVGVLISAEKMVWATQIIVFLGMLLNGSTFTLHIPVEKRIKAINGLQRMLVKRKATVKEIQQLAGLLNFLNRAVFAGHAFTRHMYAKFAGIMGKNSQLKSFHHIRLDSEFKSDCRVWLQFLNANMASVVARPYVNLSANLQLTQLEFFSDASLNRNLGFGARYDKEWTYAQWPENFVDDYDPSIKLVELYGLVVAVHIWANKLRNTRALVYCDNESVVHMINNSASSCAKCMILICGIMLKGLLYNFRVFAQHLRSEQNVIADCLSRLQFDKFKVLARKYHLRAVPEPLPEELWPITKLWDDNVFYL